MFVVDIYISGFQVYLHFTQYLVCVGVLMNSSGGPQRQLGCRSLPFLERDQGERRIGAGRKKTANAAKVRYRGYAVIWATNYDGGNCRAEGKGT